MSKRLGAMVPHPYPTPLASFTCGPHRRVCMRALPLLSLTTVSSNPSAHRYFGFRTCPTQFLPPPSRTSPLGEAFGFQGSGVLQQS